jgi:hypothetical protein
MPSITSVVRQTCQNLKLTEVTGFTRSLYSHSINADSFATPLDILQISRRLYGT